MRALSFVFAVSVAFCPKPAFSERPPMLDSTNVFSSRQAWAGGYCFGTETKTGLLTRFHINYTYRSGSTAQTTLPLLNEGEIILGKECHPNATIIFTNQAILVFPGGKSLQAKPLEARTWWPYIFDSPLTHYAQPKPLEFVAVFGDGSVFYGRLKKQTIKWRNLGNVDPESVESISVIDGHAILHLKNGSKTKFDL